MKQTMNQQIKSTHTQIHTFTTKPNQPTIHPTPSPTNQQTNKQTNIAFINQQTS
jgi:hypothetical protein